MTTTFLGRFPAIAALRTAVACVQNAIGSRRARRMLATLRKSSALSGSSKALHDQSENSSGLNASSAHDIEYVTRIYGGGMEEGKWL